MTQMTIQRQRGVRNPRNKNQDVRSYSRILIISSGCTMSDIGNRAEIGRHDFWTFVVMTGSPWACGHNDA